MCTPHLSEGPEILGESGDYEGKGNRGRKPCNENPNLCKSMSAWATPHGLAQGTKREGGTDLFGKSDTFFEKNSISQ